MTINDNSNIDGQNVTMGLKLNGASTNGHSTNGMHAEGISTDTNGLNGISADAVHYNGQIPIAICGMACRLPGGLTTPEELWDFLLAKKDGRCRVPESRYNINSYYSDAKQPGTVSTECGYFLDESVDVGALDMSFFTMTRTEVERADPQQRLMLEVAREAFEDAGVTNWRGKTIGTYIGNFGEDWLEMLGKETQPWGIHRISGSGDFVVANRLSYEFDLQGPSMTIRTACSSALVALNEACAAISRGDCESALVGGVNLILAPGMSMAMQEQGVLSKDGSCKTFSANANGYARGEAVTAVFVKPLAHALRDGNPIRAIVRATSHNADGKTPTLSQPSTDAQEALIRRAYELGGINNYAETAMVECHGTGTPTGDPIEAGAVARVFGEKGVYIGSVKPNLGHTEAASGLVSLLKMVKALEHRVIPPNIKFTSPNPNIPFVDCKLTVPTEPTPWPEDRLERVSVNSFGIGGANAHVILESAATYHIPTPVYETPETPQLLLFTANSLKSITRLVDNYKAWIEENPDKVSDLAYTLARRREHLPHRVFAIVSNGGVESVSQPTKSKSAKPPGVVMVFTGQGAQWPQMGRELLRSNEVFKSSIRSLDEYLQTIDGEKPQYTIEEELKRPGKKSKLSLAEISQPLCTAIQIALVDTLKSAGVVPDAVVGHSSGEIAAAYASGALTAREAITAAHHRGAVTNRQKRAGTMAAIGMSWEETEKYLAPNVTIACDNSPKSVTISGDVDAVKSVIATIKEEQPQILARLLQVDKAYHSYHMKEIGEDYQLLIGEEVVGRAPSVLFFSSVTGNLLSTEQKIDSKYWQDNLESPVRFKEAVTAILKHEVGKNSVFLEVGPHGALAGPLRQIFTQASSSAPYISTMARNQDCTASFLAAIGALHSLSVSIDLESLFPTGSCLPDLPRYPWNHEGSYWYETRLSKEWRNRKYPYHDLLGARVAESSDSEPVWRNLFHVTNTPWIRDHKVGENIVFPFCGYIALAGEAARQLTNIEEGFSVRNIIVSTALVLSEGKPTEILASFRPHRLTNSLNSAWWEFTVTAYNGRNWTKHCTGEVSAFSSTLGQAQNPNPLPRKLNVRKWYEKMSKGGLDLGGSFQTLDTITTSTSDQQAVGNIVNGRQGDEANYHIHPTALDGTLQILGAAAVNGYARKTKTWLPTSIDKVSVRRCASDLVTSVSARLSSNFSVVGEGRCTSGGMTVVEASGIRMSLADGAGASDVPDTHAASRCEWRPDIDFLDVNELIHAPHGRTNHLRLLEELGDICLLLSQRSFSESPRQPILPHLSKYVAWVQSQSTSIVTRLPWTWTGLDNEAISARVEGIISRLSGTPAAPVASMIHQVCTNMDSFLSGENFGNDFPGGKLIPIYDFIGQVDRKEFIRHLSHSKPNLRILEIGTGKGVSLHRHILDELTRPDGEILCSKYTLTNPGYVVETTQEKLFPNMEFASLDINKDPFDQGFEEVGYDLIIAVNALHETENIIASLANIKKLLRPDGRLFLQELCPSSNWVNYVLGLLPTWWSNAADKPAEALILGKEGWQSKLKAAEFGNIEAVTLDAEEPHQVTVTMVVRQPCAMPTKKITALVEGEGPAVIRILDQLNNQGYQVTRCKLNDIPPAGQDVISLLDAETPFFHGIDEAHFLSFKAFLLCLQDRDAGMLWVTHLIDIGCNDPRYAQILGLSRTIRTEQLADLAICQVDSFESNTSINQLLQVLAKFQARKGDEELNPDFEWAIFNERVQVARFHPFVLADELLVAEGANEKATLNVRTPGRVNSLHYERHARKELESDEVEVQVYTAGLNFRDILVALGIVELPIRLFGIEAAGIVTRVGVDVSPNDLQIGDRVVCFCRKDAFSTYTTTLAAVCVRIPDSLSFNQAGTMLIPYFTAIHSIVNVGRVSKGQSVLIHSACGGVGLAAIQVAQMLEAEVYATVGSETKVKYLMENYHIPRNRIFNSRDKTFVDGVMRETEGRGMDFILNSLSGDLLHATWSCVAEFGTLLEIGKRDLIGDGRLDMKPFLANRSYCCVDIDGLWKKIHVARALIFSILEFYNKGHISPLPTTIFPASQTQDAFRFMEKGQHIGRVGVSIKQTEEAVLGFETTKRSLTIAFNEASSYLMVGGLGGIGRAVSTWMVDHGVRELIYLSRSAGRTAKDDVFVHELRTMGCAVKLVSGDTTKLEDVQRAIAAATYPMKGIVQMSMVVANENFTKMSFGEWMASTAPKVQGTWNLHNASLAAGIDLDFFLMFSSVSGIVGQAGQANYASGNSFLDAFAQYRNGLGLAASVVDMGAVEDVGWISEHQGMMGKMSRSGFKPVLEQEVIDAMAICMLVHSKPGQAAERALAVASKNDSCFVHKNTFLVGLALLIPLHDPSNYVIWKRDRRMASYHNNSTISAAAASTDTLKSYLNSAQADPSILKSSEAARLFAVEIGKKLFDLLLKPQDELNTSWPLLDLGLDSLVALELRAWIKQVFSFDLPMLEMMSIGSLDILGQYAANEVYRIVTDNNES
ncbi:fatty acid synthase S-acetyltransferase [Nannizzia gypsea CBS 118893]|uniref:Fatty acid synthase S-acetyltransferase n=1 Tax=Arthroderma gypseum (strain ATCC MYA-4604 / CBS 118893) TaxID=535722 RepID=E5R2A6_ARTGP|nr:fatty acid synthase S-acetyltransferase [Nannizzia gypsea CBS 118893]EFQ96996.1 fatty acid synthase S-acetyltransferase [Nannizzia gypsea CBS 118893]